MKMRNFLSLFFSILVISSLLVPGGASLAAGRAAGAGSQAGPAAISHFGGHDNEFIDVTLSADSTPDVGGEVTLTLSAIPLLDAEDLQVSWQTQAGVEMNDAAEEFVGAFGAGQTFTSQRQVRFPSEGVYKIGVEVRFNDGGGLQVSGPGVLFFTVRAFGSTVSYIDPQAHNPNHTKMDTVTTVSPPASPQSPSSTPCFTVKGTIMRHDAQGFWGLYHMEYKLTEVPVANAPVDIREEDLISDDSYGVVYTDANGNYSQSFCDDDGVLDNTLEIYVRLRAELAVNGQDVVQVEDSSWVDEVYEFDSPVTSSGGGTITFNMNLDWDQSSVFNIAAAVLDAWRFWNLSGGEDGGDAVFAGEAEVHYEPGYGDDGSYYDPYQNEITIADSVDPDNNDDSVIIHEWGHYSDDWYSCDDAGSGDHSINQILEDPELSWSEGYSDYWQSAVRAWRGDLDPSTYFDLNAAQTGGIGVNLETYDVDKPSVKSSLNEMSVAAALWDLNDGQDDGQDTVAFTHTPLQKIFTSDEFQSVAYGLFDDTCTFDTYMKAWGQVYPETTATAAAVWQNTGYVMPPSGADLLPAEPGTADANAPLGGGGTPPASGLDDAMWWNQVTYVVDNSASMAGGKFNGARTALIEAVNDLGASPSGTEFSLYTFNNTSSQNTPKFAGQFFPANLASTISGLTTSASADPICKTYALRALDQAIMNQGKGDMWLFTDGDTDTSVVSVENLSQHLNDRQMHASVALMGVCPAADKQPAADIQPAAGDQAEPNLQSPAEAASSQVPSDGGTLALQGMAANMLGPLAASQLDAASTQGGLVPYLLTAINTGGQFLYVDPADVTSAAEILRAQITHSAGAGKWSDYVSTTPTYLYDRLASWEYGWVDAKTNGVKAGTPGSPNAMITISLPNSFRYFNNRSGYNSLMAYQYGYLMFGTLGASVGTNTSLPNAAMPNNALYPLWDGLSPLNILCDILSSDQAPAGTDQTDCGLTGAVYTEQIGNWFVIEYDQYVTGVGGYSNTFEVLLNSSTGEIRYQYQNVGNGGATSTIGLENSNGTTGVLVSYNDVTGASNGMGYKFTPVPPQPSKTYTVTVDSSMTDVGFLLTGFSGDFAPLTLKNPHNVVLTCASKGVTCLNLGLVQYLQVPVSGEVGTWQATVAPGASGGGSFSFSSMAVAGMPAKGQGSHKFSTLGGTFVVDLGSTVDGGQLTGRLKQPDDSPLGGAFTLFDDGLHGDGVAGDGRFGSGPFAPGKGTGYLNITGLIKGVPFKRVEQTPYTFQPLVVQAANQNLTNQGGMTPLNITVSNLDSAAHCYMVNTILPAGWWLSGLGAGRVCLSSGQTSLLSLGLYLAAGVTNTLPAGTTGEVSLGLVEEERGEISASTSVQVTRTSAAASIQIVGYVHQIKPNGDTAKLEFWVTDASGYPVADGTVVNLGAAPGGTLTPASGGTLGGVFKSTYTSGSQTGLTTVTAQTTNGVSAFTTFDVSQPEPNQITIQLNKHQMPADGSSTAIVTALVLDRYGNPAVNKQVQFSVVGDGDGPLFGGSQLVTRYTNASGVATATLTSSKAPGTVRIQAELVVNSAVVHTATDMITIGKRVFLPVMRR